MAVAQPERKAKNSLHELGYKIFLDRYAQKDMTRSTLAVGDTVIVVVDPKSGQREVGHIEALDLPHVTVKLNSGEIVETEAERLDKPLETDPAQMLDRVAAGIAAVEATDAARAEWTQRFRWMLDDWKFVPAGRILAAAGTNQDLTLYNCFVLPSPSDSRGGIIGTLGRMTEIMSRGGGVGINVSSLRPRRAYVKGVNGRSSGSVSWGALYSFVTGLIEQGGSRRGALMLILNDWHPDVLEFISSKRVAGRITNANISVGVSDAFMDAVQADADWDLVFPDTSAPGYDDDWDGDLEKWRAAGRPVVTHQTVKARELWNAIIESAWASAEPGVWFRERADKMSNSWYFSPLVCTNPCGEQSLPGFAVCNLGAVNLSRFYDAEKHDVDWENLGQTVRYAVRFLDNVIDSTPYFFEENERQQKGERRVGLNTMGIAELMIRLNIRYGSQESLEFIDRLYRFLSAEAYQTSVEIAREKGPFPEFDAEKYLQSGFMQSMPEHIREAVRTYGIRNVTLLTQAPNGCVTPDTLVFADGALRPIGTLGDPDGAQWQDVSYTTHSDSGAKAVSKFYVNGYREIAEVTTKRGFRLASTLHHRVRVIDEEGNYIWRQMGELQPGDTLAMARGGLQTVEDMPALSPIPTPRQRSQLQLPDRMSPALAELLGFYVGDGYLKARRGLGIAVDARDKSVLNWLRDLICQVFGLDAIVENTGRNCFLVWAGSYFIPRWMEYNGLAKPDSLGAFIPEPVLAGGETTVAAFLRGLFESDGSISKGIVTFATASARLAREVQIALLGLGIVATRRTIEAGEDRYSRRPRYEVRMLTSQEVLRFREKVGFVSSRKQAALDECEEKGARSDSIPHALLHKLYEESHGLPNEARQAIAGALRPGMTQSRWQALAEAYPGLAALPSAWLVDGHLFFDAVEGIRLDHSLTFDLTVPDTNTYVANGIVTHNTIGTMVNTSTGIEPFYSWVYYRKSRLGLHEEQVPLVEEWYAAHPGEEKLPDHFVTAMELSPQEHIQVQAAIQRWVDSSISKTCNVPREYTVEQVRELYEYMYALGCKGGTIYRDGSRDEQVLMLKEDVAKSVPQAAQNPPESRSEPELESAEEVMSLPRVYPRPEMLSGVTMSRKTPFGTAYITMNSDEHHNPFEVFVTVGKAGSDLQADAEGLGRMISLQLRTTPPQHRNEMMRLIIDQLRGIGGARSAGFGPGRVTSVPDAVAAVLEEFYLAGRNDKADGAVKDSSNGHARSNGAAHHEHVEPVNGEATVRIPGADICPSCGTVSLVRAEGCRKCLTCDYTEC